MRIRIATLVCISQLVLTHAAANAQLLNPIKKAKEKLRKDLTSLVLKSMNGAKIKVAADGKKALDAVVKKGVDKVGKDVLNPKKVKEATDNFKKKLIPDLLKRAKSNDSVLDKKVIDESVSKKGICPLYPI